MKNKLEASFNATAANANPICENSSQNKSEETFFRMIQAAGGTPVRKGLPDFAVFDKNNRLKALVEVKPEKGRWEPGPNQVVVLKALASLGLPCFVWSPAGLIRINQDGKAEAAANDDLTRLL